MREPVYDLYAKPDEQSFWAYYDSYFSKEEALAKRKELEQATGYLFKINGLEPVVIE